MCITMNAASLIKALLFSCFQKTKKLSLIKKDMKDVMKQISIHQENGFRILPPEEVFLR